MIGGMVNQEGVKKLQQALPDCNISHQPPPLTERLLQKPIPGKTSRKSIRILKRVQTMTGLSDRDPKHSAYPAGES